MILPNDFPTKFMSSAVDLNLVGVAGFAWNLEDTLDILEYFKNQEKDTIILGGDLYLHVPKNNLVYSMRENWYYVPSQIASDPANSVEKAIGVVRGYTQRAIADGLIVDLTISTS